MVSELIADLEKRRNEGRCRAAAGVPTRHRPLRRRRPRPPLVRGRLCPPTAPRQPHPAGGRRLAPAADPAPRQRRASRRRRTRQRCLPPAEAAPAAASRRPPPMPLPEPPTDLAYVIVNEAGASVYSASPVGREEFPDYDATLRGTISIGRRLQDPLSELVKIDPQNIGVGLYQHDVNPEHLKESLEARRRVVRQPCRRRPEHGQRAAAAPRLRPEPAGGPRAGRVPQAARPVPQPRTVDAGARHRRRRATSRRPASSRFAGGDDPLDQHLDSSRKLSGGPPAARRTGLRPRSARTIATRIDELREKLKALVSGGSGSASASRRADGPRHPRSAGPARPRPARGPAAADLQEGHPQARRPAAGHGAEGHGAERRRFRRLRGHRPEGQRPGPHQPDGQPLHQEPLRRGGGRRRGDGLGADGGSGATIACR